MEAARDVEPAPQGPAAGPVPASQEISGTVGVEEESGTKPPLRIVAGLKRVTGQLAALVVASITGNGGPGNGKSIETAEPLDPEMIAPPPPENVFDNGPPPHCPAYDSSPGFGGGSRTGGRAARRDLVDLIVDSM